MPPGTPSISEAKIGIWLPNGLRAALEESATRNGRTMSGEARWAIQHYLNLPPAAERHGVWLDKPPSGERS